VRFPTSRVGASSIFVLMLGLITASAQQANNIHKHDLYRMELATGQVIRNTFLGTNLGGASTLGERQSRRSVLVGAADFDHNGVADVLHFDASAGTLQIKFYGGQYGSSQLTSTFLVTPGAGWTPRAVADFNQDGHPDVVFVNDRSGDLLVHFYGGPQGITLLDTHAIRTESSAEWKVVGAADVNRDGSPDLILQNSSTREVMVSYLSKGSVTGTAVFGGSGVKGWTAVGMKDVNADGHADVIYTNDGTGQVLVSYYGGDKGLTFLSSDYLDSTSTPGWATVVPSVESEAMVSSGGPGSLTSATTTTASTYSTTSTGSTTVLLYAGAGTTSGDVSAVKSLLGSLGLSYTAISASQLNAMSVNQLMSHKLFLMPGGNAVAIGQYLTKTATSNVRQAISNGMHYLGLCAGGFFAGKSTYNRLQMTGVIYKFYSAYYKGISKAAVLITLPGGTKYDVYWQNGPQLSGWGYVVAKYPDGTAAITEGKYGSGFAILTGLHPEAPASWRYGMSFSTPLSVDLAYAGTLVKAALAGTYLPHY
jgi:hypothetical protein